MRVQRPPDYNDHDHDHGHNDDDDYYDYDDFNNEIGGELIDVNRLKESPKTT